MNITSVDVQGEKLRGMTTQRCSVAVTIVNQTNNFQQPALDMTKVSCKLLLQRRNKEIVIFNENLDTLVRDSMFYGSIEPYLQPSLAITKAPNPNFVFLIPLFIDLGMPINLKGDDQLFFEVNAQDNWMGPSTQVVAGSCKIDFQWRDSIGVERYIPIFRSKSIQGGDEAVDEQFGDNVVSICVINRNVTNFLSSTTPFSQFLITSDRYKINDTYDRMLARRATQFDSISQANSRYNMFKYVPDTEIQDCRVSMTLNPAQVLAGKNIIIVRSFLIDPFTYNRASSIDAKHARKDQEHLDTHLAAVNN